MSGPHLLSSSPLPTPVRDSIRPPTPPRNDHEDFDHGISAALQLLTEHLASSSPVKPPTPLAAPHLDTPPRSPTLRPIRPSLQHRSVSELRRVRFGGDIIHRELSSEDVNRTPLRPLPPSRSNSHELIRPILKFRQGSPTPPQLTESMPKYRPLAKKTFKSLEKMLEYVIERAGQSAVGPRLDAYFTLTKHLKEFRTPPDWDLLTSKLPNIILYLRRDILTDEFSTNNGDPSLQKQAIGLLTILLGLPGSRDAIPPAKMVDLVNRSVKLVSDRLDSPESKEAASRHILLLSRQKFNNLKDSELKSLLSCLRRSRSIWKDQAFRKCRLEIYENLAWTMPAKFADHAALWIDVLVDQLQNALSDAADSSRKIARSVGIYPEVGRALNKLLLSQSPSSKQVMTIGDELRNSLCNKAGSTSAAIKAWAAISVLLKTTNKSKRSALHEGVDPFWGDIFEAALRTEGLHRDSSVCFGEFIHSQTNVMHSNTPREDYLRADGLLPLNDVAHLIESGSRQSVQSASDRCLALLYQAFRPSLSDQELDQSWSNYLPSENRSQSESPVNYAEFLCAVLTSLFRTTTSSPYVDDRLLNGTTVNLEELPTLRPSWVLSRFSTISEELSFVLRWARWDDSEIKDNEEFFCWPFPRGFSKDLLHNLFLNIGEARKIEITKSASTKNMIDSLTKLLESWSTPEERDLMQRVADMADEVMGGGWRTAFDQSIARREAAFEVYTSSSSSINQLSLKSPKEAAVRSLSDHHESGKTEVQRPSSLELQPPIVNTEEHALSEPRILSEQVEKEHPASFRTNSSSPSQSIIQLSPRRITPGHIDAMDAEGMRASSMASFLRAREESVESSDSNRTKTTESLESAMHFASSSESRSVTPEVEVHLQQIGDEEIQELSLKVPDALPLEEETEVDEQSITLEESVAETSEMIEDGDVSNNRLDGIDDQLAHAPISSLPVESDLTTASNDKHSGSPLHPSNSTLQEQKKKRGRRTQAQLLEEQAAAFDKPLSSGTGDGSKPGRTMEGISNRDQENSTTEKPLLTEAALQKILDEHQFTSETSSVLSSIDSGIEDPFVSARGTPRSSRRSSLRHSEVRQGSATKNTGRSPAVVDMRTRSSRRSTGTKLTDAKTAPPRHQDEWEAIARQAAEDASQESSRGSQRTTRNRIHSIDSPQSVSSVKRTVKGQKKDAASRFEHIDAEDSPSLSHNRDQGGKRKATEVDETPKGSPQQKRNKPVPSTNDSTNETPSKTATAATPHSPVISITAVPAQKNAALATMDASKHKDSPVADDPHIADQANSDLVLPAVDSHTTKKMTRSSQSGPASSSSLHIDVGESGEGSVTRTAAPETSSHIQQRESNTTAAPSSKPPVAASSPPKPSPTTSPVSSIIGASPLKSAIRAVAPMSPPSAFTGIYSISPRRAAALKSTERIAEQYKDPWHKRQSSDCATGSMTSPRTPKQKIDIRPFSTPQPVKNPATSLFPTFPTFPNLKAPEPAKDSRESSQQEDAAPQLIPEELVKTTLDASSVDRTVAVVENIAQSIEIGSSIAATLAPPNFPVPQPKDTLVPPTDSSTRKRKRDDELELDTQADTETNEPSNSRSRTASPAKKLKTWVGETFAPILQGLSAFREKLPLLRQSGESLALLRDELAKSWVEMATLNMHVNEALKETEKE